MGFLGDISAGAVGGLLGGVGQLAKDVREAITGDLPADKKADIEAKLMALENQAQTAQTAINMEEAKHENVFVSGWRPFVGWVGGFALLYASVLEPLLSWSAKVFGGYTGAFPVIDTTITMQVLFGILGLGAFRSVDKIKAPGSRGGV